MNEETNEQANQIADDEVTGMPSAYRGALAIPDPDEENELLVRRERFSVTDFKSASWVAQKIKACRAYVEDVKKWAKAEERKAQQAEEFYLSAYGGQLKELAQNTLADAKKKYLDLPGARIQLRKQPVKLVIEDEEVALSWAQDHCRDALTHTALIDLRNASPEQLDELTALLERFNMGMRVEMSLAKSELNNHFKNTGEVPSGCRVEGGEDEVYVI